MKKEILIMRLSGQISCTIIIPKEFAEEHGFANIKEAGLEHGKDRLLIKKMTSLKNADEGTYWLYSLLK